MSKDSETSIKGDAASAGAPVPEKAKPEAVEGDKQPTTTPQVNLIVASEHGNPDPPNGITMEDKGSPVVCSVESPVREGLRIWKCTGWETKTGDTVKPNIQQGTGTSASFPISEDTWLTWKWKTISFGEGIMENSAWVNQVISLVLLAIIFIFSLTDFYVLKHALVLSVFAGALGGLVHELAQSYGRFLLPNTDAKGNFCLGGLVGIASGGVAGLFTYQGLMGHTASVTPTLAVTAIVAGLAAKGIADAPNPPTSKSTTSTPSSSTKQRKKES